MTDSQTQQLHQQADLLLNSNRLVDAHTVYEQICRLDSSDAEAFMMRGALEGEMGKVDDAIQSLNEAIQIDPKFADAYHTLAHLLQHQGKLVEARDTLKEAVAIDPEFTEAWAMLSGLLGQLEEFAAAEIASRHALKLDPGLTDARANLANSLLEQGKDKEAVIELQQIAQLQPGNENILSRLGATLTRLERFGEAVPILETGLQLNPSNIKAQTALAYAYLGEKNFTKAVEQFHRVIENDPEVEQNWAKLTSAINEHNKEGDWQTLVDFCRRLENRFPGNRHVALNQGYALEKLNNMEAALSKYKQVTVEFPDWGEGWNRLGLLYMEQEENHKALTALKKALGCGIDSPLTLCMYGAALRTYGNYKEAEHYCKLAQEKAPELVPVYAHLGIVQTLMGNLEQAMDTFKKGRDLDADNLSLVTGVAEVLERQGKLYEANEILEPYLNTDQNGIAGIACVYARVSNKLKRGEQALGLVEKLLAEDGVLRASGMDMHFRAADIYHSMQLYDKAIEHYHQANALSDLEFNHDAHARFIDDTIAAFSKETLAKLSSLGDPSARPVFILGMPRSGTSLAEQILASHPDVFGAGELMEFAVVAKGLKFDETDARNNAACLTSLNSTEVSQYAKAYLKSIDELSNGERFVTDKMPYNYLRLGLIQILFPNARIIHTRRDPMDTCLSCYFLDFMGTHPHAYDLEDLGVYYSEYERLMAHWHDVLSIPILDVQYEEAVEDIEASCRNIIEFCELEWDDRVLNFHQSDRVVRTASYDQVRRPIYTSSIGRWKPYEQWLDPLKKGLSS